MKTEKEKAHIDFLYRTKYLPAYLAFIACYPFGLEDLEGEIWEDIKGYEGLYQISNFARVKSFPRQGVHEEKILKPSIIKGGYLQVALRKGNKRKYFKIHRLAAETFIPNPENKSTVNHKDGNKFNNCVENLEWATPSENIQHSVKIGLQKSGENCSYAKLTNDQARWIREHYKPRDSKYGAAALARRFNVDPSAVQNIVHGRTYKNIDTNEGDENFE